MQSRKVFDLFAMCFQLVTAKSFGILLYALWIKTIFAKSKE